MPLQLSPTQTAFNARGDGTFHKPFPEQVAYLLDKLDIPTERWDDILAEANDRSFIVAGAAKADLLADFHAAVVKAAEDGKSIQWFKANFEAIVAKNGWTAWTGEGSKFGRDWRARVIYRTNLSTSYAAGRFAQLNDPDLLSVLPYWKYVHNDTVQHPRPIHQQWGRKPVVLPPDDPWWRTHFPPNGWGCRCRVTAVSRDEYLGDSAPDDGEWTQKDSKGHQHVLPKGVEYGWNYAPGASRLEELRKLAGDKAKTLPKELGKAFLADMKPD
jgi:uncharacterized protein with gpF-like domain